MNGNRKTILLVEDETLIAMATRTQLERVGYTVDHVLNGEAAIASALDPDARIDLILMDIDLGKGIDGTEAARQILNEIDIPVVFLSSHTDPDVVEKTEKITSYGYVVKNSGITVLDASIKMAFKLFESRMHEQRSTSELLHSRDLMRYVIEHTRGAVAVHDRDLKYVYVSKQYLDQFNVKDRDVIGRHHYEIFPDLPQKFKEAHRRALRGEVTKGENDPYHRDDGTIISTRWECRPWYDADDSIGGLIVYTDVVPHAPANGEETRDTVNYLRSILRTTRDGFCVLDMDGNFLDVNDAYCTMCGYSREEFLQLSIPDIDAERQPGLTADRMQRIRSAGYALFHARNRRKDGTLFDVEVSASFLGGPEDRIVAFYRDITTRIQVEKKLKERDQLLQKILDNSVDLISITDLEGTFLNVSKSHELLGYDGESLIGTNVADLVHPDDAQTIAGVMRDILVFRKQQTGEYRYRRADGDYRWFESTGITLKDQNGEPVQILFNTRDITERKQVEETLDRERTLLRTIIDSIPDAIYVKDLEGRKQVANRTECHFSGFEREEDLIGKHDFDIYPPEIAGPFVEDDQRVLIHGERVINREERRATRNGELVWQLTSKLPLYDRDGTTTGLVGIGRDITKRKQVEQEIQRQIAEKEILLKEVHHRIKNNMAQVESLLSLQAYSVDNAEVKSALNEAMSRVRATRTLYEKLLVGKNNQEVSMKDYLESLIESHAEVYNDHAGVSIETSLVDLSLSAKKATPVGIILNELLTNVFKYAFGGRAEGRVIVKLERIDNRARLTVIDNGIGFDSRVAANTSPGFGLTLTEMLAEQLKGTFSIASDNGTRSVVEFEI